MILIDIYVPLIDKVFDFTVDETARVDLLVEELAEIICQKEHWPRLESARKLMLCDREGQRIFPKDATLAGMGITSGCRLMLL